MANVAKAEAAPIHKRKIVAWRVPADMLGVGALLLLTVFIAWDRLAGGWALQHLDIVAFFIPMYGFLGEQLRSGNIPGWNPHQLSGTPFAGDPESGWMYLPAMLFFTLLPKVTAFKFLTAFHLGLAGISTYALGRVLGMGVLGSFAAGLTFEFGSFKELTGCCTVYAQLSAWVPLALLGAELALRSTSWTPRLNWWILTAFAVSQMFTGWFGQGTYYGLLVLGAYIAYRTVIAPPPSIQTSKDRFAALVLHGAVILILSFGLAAAGLLPRLDVISHSTLAGGDYSGVAPHVARSGAWTLDEIAVRLLGIRETGSNFYAGGAALLLASLSPLLARRRHSTLFFVLVALAAAVLTMPDTPLHHLFYMLPKFELLHGHYPHRILIIFNLTVALLAGAAVAALPRWRGDRAVAKYTTFGVISVIVVLTLLRIPVIDIPPLMLGSIVIVWFLLAVHAFLDIGRASSIVAVLLIGVLFIDPTGWTLPDRYPRERGDAQVQRIINGYESTSGPVAFLKEQDAAVPARFTGYELGMSGESRDPTKFYGQYRASRLIAVIINNRALYLGLYDIQGYNPVQVARYNSYIRAMNGEAQEYHESHLLPGGVGSPLLDLLGVRHIVVPALVPPGRPDLFHMSQTYPAVYADKWVRILQNEDAFPGAWIVHEAEQVAAGGALPLMTSGEVDLRTTAVLETDPPPLEVPADASADKVTVEQYEPDRIQLTASTDASGLLMLSEIYDPGWKAYVGGDEVGLYVADHTLRAVPLPPGEHTVELRYEPRSLQVGLAISGFTSLGVLGIWFMALARRLRNRSTTSRRQWALPRPSQTGVRTRS